MHQHGISNRQASLGDFIVSGCSGGLQSEAVGSGNEKRHVGRTSGGFGHVPGGL